MKVIAVIIMLYALFLLHRIAFPKCPAAEKGVDKPEKDTKTVRSVMGKSSFVLPERSKPLQTPAISTKDENIEKKEYMFAAGNETRNAVIPNEELDKIFDETDPDDLDIDPDEDGDESQSETADVEDEAAEFETGAEMASGMSIEEMTEAAKAIDKPTDDKAEILFRVEKTDMFEQLVSGDEGKAQRIKAIIDRHFRSLQPKVEIENTESSEWNEFDIRNHLRKTIKK